MIAKEDARLEASVERCFSLLEVIGESAPRWQVRGASAPGQILPGESSPRWQVRGAAAPGQILPGEVQKVLTASLLPDPRLLAALHPSMASLFSDPRQANLVSDPRQESLLSDPRSPVCWLVRDISPNLVSETGVAQQGELLLFKAVFGEDVDDFAEPLRSRSSRIVFPR